MIDVINQAIEQVLCFLVKILRIYIFPLLNPFSQACFHVVGLEAESANLMLVLDTVDPVLEFGEFFKLVLKVFELRVGSMELLKVVGNLVFPKPVVVLKAL